ASSAAATAPDKWGNVDLSGLTTVQKKAVMKLLHEQDCSCQCGLKTADCILQDPDCSYSRVLAGIAIKGVKDGKTLIEISKLMDVSPKAHRPKLLEDPVVIQTAGAPALGPADARITLVEFSDFECPYCALAMKQVKALMAAYPKDIRLFYKQFPLSMHPHAQLAAEAALAANEQGKFWEMHDLLFGNFRKLSRENMLAWAGQIGLDVNKFKADLDGEKFASAIKKDTADGDSAGVYGTPAFFINGKLYNGPMTVEAVKPILDAELKGGAKTVAKKAN
ncbi:MAG TPA: DsbA family protein, partial [Bryobacteraceae bacterium]